MRRAFTGRAAGFRRLVVVVGLGGALAAASGCAPMAAPPPMTTMQRGRAPPRGASAFAMGVGLGGGGVGWGEGAGGLALQQRSPLGDGELQLSGQAVAYECSGCIEDKRGTHISVGGRVGLREQLGPGLALLVGGGLAGGAGGTAVGGDIGVVTDLGRLLYLAPRAGISRPVTKNDVYNPRDDDGDGVEERVMDPTTVYGMIAGGLRLGRQTGFLAEIGVGVIRAGEENGAAVYGLLGVDVLKLAGN